MEEANSLPDKVFETEGEILALYGQHGIIQVITDVMYLESENQLYIKAISVGYR